MSKTKNLPLRDSRGRFVLSKNKPKARENGICGKTCVSSKCKITKDWHLKKIASAVILVIIFIIFAMAII